MLTCLDRLFYFTLVMPLRKKKNLEQKPNTGQTNEDKSTKQQEEPSSSTDKEPEDIKKSESGTAEQNVQEKPQIVSDTSGKKSDDTDAEKMQEKSTDAKDMESADTKGAVKSQGSDDNEVDGIYKCVSQPPTFERHLVSRYQFIKRNDTYAMRKGASVNNGPNVLVLSQSEMLDIKNAKMEEDYHIVSTASGKYHILYPDLSEITHYYKIKSELLL